MTLLVAWLAVDVHGPSSIYIAADSRISWGRKTSYSQARKVFSSRGSADILGYCGDVSFPSMALAQIVEMIDAGLLFEPTSSPEERSHRIAEKLKNHFAEYPSENSEICGDSLEVIHASREYVGGRFECRLISWSKTTNWTISEAMLPDHSDTLFVRGSGADEFNHRLRAYGTHIEEKTSRRVFQCFCESLAHTAESTVGGAPQLVGIMRRPKSPGIDYGIILSKQRYFLGSQVDDGVNFQKIEWRNISFERCNGKTMSRLPKAKRQPNPRAE